MEALKDEVDEKENGWLKTNPVTKHGWFFKRSCERPNKKRGRKAPLSILRCWRLQESHSAVHDVAQVRYINIRDCNRAHFSDVRDR